MVSGVVERSMVAIHNRSILCEDVRKISHGLFDVNCSFQRTPLETLAQTMDCNKHKMLKVWCLLSASGWHLDRLQAKTMDIAVGKSHRVIQRHHVDAIQQDEIPLPCCDSEIPNEKKSPKQLALRARQDSLHRTRRVPSYTRK